MQQPATGTLTIDLSAVCANWHTLARRLGHRPAAVIKADAYGLGAEPVARAVYAAGCREFFLATLDEALQARRFLPEAARLYVFGGAPPGAEARLLAQELVPVLYSLEGIDRWARACREADRRADAVIKVDTGMTRLGLSEEEWQALIDSPERLAPARCTMIMSHLACADRPDHAMNREQLERFRRLVEPARARWPEARFSLANSGGVALGADWHFDLARPGASLYGFEPHAGAPLGLAPAVTLRVPVLQLRTLTQEAAIGYGATERRPAGTRLAVVAGGYADGLHRVIGREGGLGYLGETPVPVVGRISMDSTVFDVTGAELPDPPEAAEITLLDHRLTVGAVSRQIDALGYEVLTGLAGRYRRVYRGGEA